MKVKDLINRLKELREDDDIYVYVDEDGGDGLVLDVEIKPVGAVPNPEYNLGEVGKDGDIEGAVGLEFEYYYGKKAGLDKALEDVRNGTR